MPVKIQVPDKLIPLIIKPKPLKIIVGGRGSGKSEAAASCMLKFCDDGERVLCAREFQNSLDDSVHSLVGITQFPKNHTRLTASGMSRIKSS